MLLPYLLVLLRSQRLWVEEVNERVDELEGDQDFQRHNIALEVVHDGDAVHWRSKRHLMHRTQGDEHNNIHAMTDLVA